MNTYLHLRNIIMELQIGTITAVCFSSVDKECNSPHFVPTNMVKKSSNNISPDDENKLVISLTLKNENNLTNFQLCDILSKSSLLNSYYYNSFFNAETPVNSYTCILEKQDYDKVKIKKIHGSSQYISTFDETQIILFSDVVNPFRLDSLEIIH